LPLLALSNEKKIIDLETVRDVCAILDYELKLRMLTDPIDADNAIAKLEEGIRRTLKVKGLWSFGPSSGETGGSVTNSVTKPTIAERRASSTT
jgi:hypothetical protein